MSSLFFFVAAIFVFALFSTPSLAHAVNMEADAMCTCQMDPKKPRYCPTVPCKDTTSGFTTPGICVAPLKCKATATAEGKNTGLDQVMKALGELFGKLMSQPKPPETPPTTQPPITSPTGCQGARFPTHDISLISNPCADFTPEPIIIDDSTTTSGCSLADEALGLCTPTPGNCPDVPIVDCDLGHHVIRGGVDADGCVLQDTCELDTTTPTTTVPPRTDTPTRSTIFATTTGTIGGLVVPPGGARGDINAWANNATIVGGTRDTQNNVEVAGFYGSQTFGAQGTQGLIGDWCKTRPWTTNFLSKVVASSFFDGLCSWRGYQVGTPPPPVPLGTTVTLQQTAKPKSTTTTTATSTTTPKVTPKVDIWAVPASVPLGARTSIFWNTQGVTNCTETSPNGGFSQSSLSGGAATQPITSATTFSISCLAPDGSPVTDSVIVSLKI